ncbi:YgaP family membrane protein [Kordia sp.]|uniref:YgaP family membrane protein n=1 Tax=Kordia sp. TaxID=1965332 RepID=UPI003B5AD0D2
MKKNMANADRIIRVLITITVTILYFTNVISGTLGIVLVGIAAVLLLTSFINFCPLYSIFGISTRKES